MIEELIVKDIEELIKNVKKPEFDLKAYENIYNKLFELIIQEKICLVDIEALLSVIDDDKNILDELLESLFMQEEYDAEEQELEIKNKPVLATKEHLINCYINSIIRETNPVWTIEHIEELLNDFDVFFKEKI